MYLLFSHFDVVVFYSCHECIKIILHNVHVNLLWAVEGGAALVTVSSILRGSQYEALIINETVKITQ